VRGKGMALLWYEDRDREWIDSRRDKARSASQDRAWRSSCISKKVLELGNGWCNIFQ
jgi:hypothetical protein